MIVIDKDVDLETLPEKTDDKSYTPFNYLIFTKKTKKIFPITGQMQTKKVNKNLISKKEIFKINQCSLL